MFKSTKIVDGFSTCFRQWVAEDTHCKFLHGYSIYFELQFTCNELNDYNWVYDFGGFKRSKTKIEYDERKFSPTEWFNYMFDHTTLIAEDDPELDSFKELERRKVLQLRVLEKCGCEMFAKLVFEIITKFLAQETDGRVQLTLVRCYEHVKNSAIYANI